MQGGNARRRSIARTAAPLAAMLLARLLTPAAIAAEVRPERGGDGSSPATQARPAGVGTAVEPGRPPGPAITRWVELFERTLDSADATREILGPGRLRQSDELGFRVTRRQLSPVSDLFVDLRERAWMESVALGALNKITRELIIRHSAIREVERSLDEKAEAWDATERRLGFELSPRVGFGSGRYLGIETRLGHPGFDGGPGHRRLTLELRHGLDSGRHLVRLGWSLGAGEITLEHRPGSAERPAEASLLYRRSID